MKMHATEIRPAPADFWMPSIEQYMALAEAMHSERDDCNANYYVGFDECGAREADIEDAVRVLMGLHKEGWSLVRDLGGHGIPLGLPA